MLSGIPLVKTSPLSDVHNEFALHSQPKNILEELDKALDPKNPMIHRLKATKQNESIKISKENNGRWSKEECKRFEEGLKKFGKNWKKVEVYVRTRTGTQIRSHAQKYFLSLKEKGIKSHESDSNKISELDRNELGCMKEVNSKTEKSIISESPMPIPIQSTPKSLFPEIPMEKETLKLYTILNIVNEVHSQKLFAFRY